MSLVPAPPRRAALRLGASAVAGAAGIWTFGALVDPTQVPADPSPFDPAAPAGAPARSDRAAAPGDRPARGARQRQTGDEFRRRTGARRSGQGGPAAVRRGIRR